MAEARLIDGKAAAAALRAEIGCAVQALSPSGITPGLATVLVGEDPARRVYVRNKIRACAEAGIGSIEHALPAATAQDDLLALITRLNQDQAVDGILVQLPLPAEIDAERVIEAEATSRVFRFVDDVVVRMRGTDGGCVNVDMRSTSRVGRSDLGANAARIVEFLESL